MKILAGLGNPGKEYESTRHNAGFMAVDRIASRLGAKLIKAKHKALVGENIYNGEKVMLMKPMTFMNLSGESIKDALSFYKLTPEDFIVIYDDESLPVGSVRVRESGSDGGHNGMKSIISHLGTQEFMRVRIGIGEKPEGWDLADYVLSKFCAEEMSDIDAALSDAADCALLMLRGNVLEAMNRYNRRTSKNAGDEA